MIAKPLNLIEKADIEALLADGVAESRTLEYKEALPGEREADKHEFLADVSSLANAAGGDLVYGVCAERDANGKPTGRPAEILGLEGNLDEAKLRIENLLQNGLDPRVPGVQMQPVAGFPKGSILVVRVPKSWAGPHMIRSSSRFYSRNSAGKYPLDVREIRAAFVMSESLADKVRRFRDDRLAKIIADETPMPLDDARRVVLHLIPVSAFTPGVSLDLKSVYQNTAAIEPLCSNGWNRRWNFDGVLSFTGRPNEPTAFTYLQVFRNGCIEACETILLSYNDPKKLILSIAYEEELIEGLGRMLKLLRDNGIQPPVFLSCALLGVRGYGMGVGSGYPRMREHAIERDHLIPPEVMIEDLQAAPHTSLKPIFDVVWQAAGWAGSRNYDEQGNWRRHAS